MFARIEKNDEVAFSDGDRVKRVPGQAWCRERLIKLLEESGGATDHPVISQFWNERAKDISSQDELIAAWAKETWDRLERIWDELTTPVVGSSDVFESFGL